MCKFPFAYFCRKASMGCLRNMKNTKTNIFKKNIWATMFVEK